MKPEAKTVAAKKSLKADSGASAKADIDLPLSVSPLWSAILLGACELIIIGAASNYLTMQGLGVSVLFAIVSFLIVCLSIAALAWGVVKHKSGNEVRTGECIKVGVSLGICAAIGVCVFALVFTIVGILPDNLAQEPLAEHGLVQIVARCLKIFVMIIAFYVACGVLAGMLAQLIMRLQRKSSARAAHENARKTNA